MSRTPVLAKKSAVGRFTGRIGGLLFLSIMTIVTIQYWWKLPLERLGSPADILGLMLGLALGFACLLVGFRAEPRSPASRAFTGMASLFLALTLVEYIADAGPIDIPISFLWLMPVLVLTVTRLTSGPARLSFAVCTLIQLAEVVRSILATAYYGGSAEPVVFEWIESASDLLLRAFLLLGFVETLRLDGMSGPIAGSLAHNSFASPRADERWRHVALFMYKLSGGGAQRRSVALANGLAERGYDVDFVVINDQSKLKQLLAPGLRVIALNSPRWGGLHAALYRHFPFRWIRVYFGVIAFARYLQVAKPGTIVAGSSRVLLSAVIAWRIAGRTMPLVLRATNFPSGNLNLWAPLRPIVDLYLRALLRLVFPPASATVAVADGVAEEVARLSGVPRGRIATVFEPVLDGTVVERSKAPLDHPWLAQGEPPVLLAVGRLRMQKDFPTLIRGFALARAKRPMRLVVLGEGRDRPRLQKMAESLGIADDLCLFGYTENPFAWMARVSIFVLSSAWEGLPAVLIEALACGCPVVSTNCPSGPWEILDRGKYGTLVPCRDPERLAEAILAALDTPVDRQALVERARAFSAEASVDGYIQVLEACHAEDRVGARAGPGSQYRRGFTPLATVTSEIRGQRMPERVGRPGQRGLPPDDGLIVRGLRKSFGHRPVVKGVNLSVKRGEAVGLLGPNGAGKTTVFYMITGLIAADQGTISLDGTDITTLPMHRRARLGIGFLSQESSIFRALTVEDNICAVLEFVEPSRKRRESELRELLEEFSISHLRHSPAVTLSGGERRRVEIARALATHPQFMLLDEPLAGIDPIAIGDIRQMVRQLTARGIGVLITDHKVRETLELIDRALIIHEGEVLTEGTPHEIVNDADVRRFYLGEDFSL